MHLLAKAEYNNRAFDIDMHGQRNLEFEVITDSDVLRYYFALLIRFPSVLPASPGPPS